MCVGFFLKLLCSPTPAPPEARGREPPFFFFFLDLLLRWEKGFPSGPRSPWRGRGESPSKIGYISLSLSLFPCSLILPFHHFLYIQISVTPIGLKPSPRFFFRKIALLRTKKSSNRLTGAHEGGRCAPCLVPPLGHRLALILLPKNHKYSKKNLC